MIHRVNVEFPDVYILVRLYRNFSRPWDEFHQSIQPAISSIQENIDNYRGNIVVLLNDDSWTDDEDRIKYIIAMNTERDTYNQIEYARESGREEGLKEGREEGREEGLKEGHKKGHEEGKEEGLKEGRAEGVKQTSFDIAKRMLEKGIDIETISELTGLTEKEISELSRIND